MLLSFAGSDPGADVCGWDWPLPSAWLSLHGGTTEKKKGGVRGQEEQMEGEQEGTTIL